MAEGTPTELRANIRSVSRGGLMSVDLHSITYCSFSVMILKITKIATETNVKKGNQGYGRY